MFCQPVQVMIGQSAIIDFPSLHQVLLDWADAVVVIRQFVEVIDLSPQVAARRRLPVRVQEIVHWEQREGSDEILQGHRVRGR